MVRRGSHPRLSVILVVEGSPSYAMRALESIQNQDLYDLQIVVVCRDAAPGVRHSLQVAADRDIHIDLIDVEDAKRGACLRAGFAASRGSQIIAMNADEWFAPQSLSKMVDIACDTAADIVLPTVSLDRYDAHRERHSRVLDAAHISIDSKSSMVAGLPQLILGGLVAQTSGVMYSRPLFEACLLCDKAFRTVGFMAYARSRRHDSCPAAATLVSTRWHLSLQMPLIPPCMPGYPMTLERSTSLRTHSRKQIAVVGSSWQAKSSTLPDWSPASRICV
ncbi:MAG: glycosyltransferase [Collinsella sp.]